MVPLLLGFGTLAWFIQDAYGAESIEPSTPWIIIVAFAVLGLLALFGIMTSGR